MLAKGTFSRLPISSKMLIATIIPLCLFALLAMTSFYAIRSLEHSAKLVEQTHGVLANAAIIEKRLLELEVLRLGSIPSDKVDNVRRYLEIKESLFDKLAETERLVSASPAQVARIQAIRIELKGLLIDESYLQKRTRVENEKKDNSVLKEVRASLGSFASVEKNLMKARKQESLKNSARSNTIIVIGTMLVIALSLAFSLLVIRLINRQLTKTTEIAERVAEGYYDIKIHLNNSSDRLGKSLQRMTHALKENATALNLEKEKLKAQDWIKSNHSDIIAKLQGLNDLGLFSEKLLNKLIPAINAHLGLFYFKEQHDESVTISLLSSYAFNNRKNLSNKYSLGEGLVGQCVLEKKAILLLEAPADYLEISSGSGRTLPKNILVTPIMFEHEVVAALEIASVCKIDDKSKALIELLTKSLGVLINNILSQKMTRDLLRQSQDLSEELQAQQEELRHSNEELAAKTKVLQDSENELKAQGEELQTANEELEEKGEYLKQQKNQIEEKNRELIKAKDELEKKARELEQSGTYKSEFLANMSHELRTPLNSLLILSKALAENEEGNLSKEQVSECEIIHNGGQELLLLINDILDLSKVEAGKMELLIDDVSIKRLTKELMDQFNPVAKKNSLNFKIEISEALPEIIAIDAQKVSQIIKNLLSNAFKFTDLGSVQLKIYPANKASQTGIQLKENESLIVFAVSDTGIGIPEEKQRQIFQAFQQADGSTSRQYGGTGLGLTISRKLADLMRGRIELNSEMGTGTTFRLLIPVENLEDRPNVSLAADEDGFNAAELDESEKSLQDDELEWIPDDRDSLLPGSNVLLIIEDDRHFANILINEGRRHGFKCVVTNRGSRGLSLALKYQPIAIILDLGLPDMPGGQVLKGLKEDLDTRHIPVHIVSAAEKHASVLEAGAIGFLQKPVKKQELANVFNSIEKILKKGIKRLLIVEDDPMSQRAIQELIKNDYIDILTVDSGKKASTIIQTEELDCIVLDLKLPDMSGIDLLKQLSHEKVPIPPVIVYTGRALTDNEYELLRKFTSSIVIKGADSPERLFDEVSLFLHSVDSNLPKEQKKIIEELHTPEKALQGKTVLIVDDDMRNLFALSKILKKYGLCVEIAKDGKFALSVLNKMKAIDVVIMDIMMPIMDGYTAIENIRKMEKFKDLPIIALTAKAMPEDRQKCIDVGASDYLTKPIDVYKLLSLMRVWLGKS